MRQAVLFTAVATVLVCLLSPAPAGATGTTIFISHTTSPTHLETHTVDISAGPSGELGIWVIPDMSQNLNLIDLNLRIAEQPGVNAIDFSGATVWNPPIDGAGGAKRWFDDNVTTGVGIDSVTDNNLITGMIGDTIGGLGAGTGLSDANGPNDPLYDVSTGAYLFATVYYDVVNSSEMADLYLQIGDDRIENNGVWVDSVEFGLIDPLLNAGQLHDLNVDSATEDAATSSVPVDPPIDLLGDMTGDDLLNLDDVSAFILALVNRPAYNATYPLVDEVSAGDINDDLMLDLGDIGLFSVMSFGLASASAEAVPEPSTIVLTGIGLLILVGNGRRRRS